MTSPAANTNVLSFTIGAPQAADTWCSSSGTSVGLIAGKVAGVAKYVMSDRQNLGLLCPRQGRPAEAEAHLRDAVAERQDFVQAWFALGDLWAARQRFDEFEQAEVEALTRHAPGAGHTYSGPVAHEVDEAFRWLVEDDPRWTPPEP